MIKKYFLLLLLLNSSIVDSIKTADQGVSTQLDEDNFKSMVRPETNTEEVSNFYFDGYLGNIKNSIEFGFASMNNARNSGYSNQDAGSIGSYVDDLNNSIFIFTVCDGHGKEPKATNIAREVIIWWPQSLLETKKVLESDWNQQNLYEITAEKVQEKAVKMQAEDSAGTTMTSVIFYKDQQGQPQAIFSNVGDSRSLLIRDGKCIYATKDHKPGDPKEKARIEKAGGTVIQPDPKRDFYRINFGNKLAVSRTFGDSQDRPCAIEEPTTRQMKNVLSGDYFVLATDGFWDIVSNEKIAQKLKEMENKNQSLQEFVTETIKKIGLKSKTNPKHYKQNDDITLLIAKIK